MRNFISFLFTIIFLFISLPVLAQGQSDELPQGWNIRLDDTSNDLGDLEFTTSDGVLHFVIGSGSAIYYKEDMSASGSYGVMASFTQLEKGKYPEGYGIFIGGNNLQAEDQQYLYFLVRQDGSYLIKHRNGSETELIVDWTVHDAVQKMETSEPVTNTLKIERGEDTVTFLVNGTKVNQLPVSELRYLDGTVGLRINHHLNVEVSDFEIVE